MKVRLSQAYTALERERILQVIEADRVKGEGDLESIRR
jgi:hypothetical protein